MYNVENLSNVYKRPLTLSATLLGAPKMSENGLSIELGKIEVKTGEWVTVDTDGKAIKIDGILSDKIAYPVFSGSDEDHIRTDIQAFGVITTIYGKHIATTDVYAKEKEGSPIVYTKGMDLTIEDSVLRPAKAGEIVVATVEQVLPNGLKISVL